MPGLACALAAVGVLSPALAFAQFSGGFGNVSGTLDPQVTDFRDIDNLFAAANVEVVGKEFELSQNNQVCMGTRDSGTTNGNPLIVRSCTYDDKTRFRYDPESGYLIHGGDPTKCIHKKQGNTNNGNPIHIWSCDGGPPENKTWDLGYDGSIRLRHATNKCIHKKESSADASVYNIFWLWDCNSGHNNQTFEHGYHSRPSHLMLAQNPMMCLDLESETLERGNRAQLQECMRVDLGDSPPIDIAEGFIYDSSNGHLVLVRNNYWCLAKQRMDTNNGNPIHLWECEGGVQTNKAWDLGADGSIRLRADPTKCIHKQYGNTSANNPMHLWDCNPGANNQTFITPGSAPASVANMPSLRTACGANDPYQAYLFERSKSFGDTSKIAASYSMKAGIADRTEWIAETGDASVPSDYLYLGAEADAVAHLFGHSLTIFGIGAKAERRSGGQSNEAYIVAIGRDLYRRSIGVDYSYSIDQTLLEASATFYGVTVSGEITGTIGFDANATLGATGIQVSVEPYAGVVATGSAGVGAFCFEAGVGSDVTVLNLSVPTEGSIALLSSGMPYSASSDLVISTLDGSMYLYLNYCIDSATYELFSWDGLTTTTPLMSVDGCIN